MNTMFLSDTYGVHEGLLLPHGDMIIHGGNLTEHGKESEVKDFFQWLSHLNYKYRIVIAGMQDKIFEEDPGMIKRLLPSNVIYLEDSGVEIRGIRLWGTPYNTFNHGSAFSVGSEEIKDHWDKIPDDTNIVIGRNPAFGIQDEDIDGAHIGCKHLLRRLVRVAPSYFVCGNVHGMHRYEHRHDINFVNASLLNKELKVIHKPVFSRNP